MTRTRLLLAIAAIVAAGGVVWFVRRSPSNDTVYRLATIERGNIRQTVSATGTLSAVKTVQVGTQVSGQLAAIFADFNSHVTKGQLLARIDPVLQQQAVQDAQAQLERARAQQDQAQQEYDRNLPLYQKHFISATEFGTVQVNLSVAQSGLKSAQVALDRARQNLSYTEIHSPIDGVVVERNVDVGQTVAASLSAPQLFLIAQDLSQMQIIAAVDESDISAIKEGQTATFTVESFPGRTFNGTVKQVRLQSKLTDNVVSYSVVVTLDNPGGQLFPGMTATVAFITGAADNVLTAPNAALRFRPGEAELKASGLATTDSSRGRGNASYPGSYSRTDSTGTGPRRRTPSIDASVPNAPDSGRSGRGGTWGAATPGGGTNFGTLWTVDAKNRLLRTRVRTGLSDGQRTEVSGDGVTEGMQVVIGVTSSDAANAARNAPQNPLAPQGRGRGRGGF